MNPVDWKTRMRNLLAVILAIGLATSAADLDAQGVTYGRLAPEPPTPPAPPLLSSFGRGPGDGVARIDTTVPFAADGSVDLSLIVGAMKISTWNRNEVRIVARTTGVPSLHLDVGRSRLTLEQSRRGYDRDRGDVGTATYDVTVPAGTRATLSAVSGDITASGLRNRVEVQTVSGAVNVRDVGSTLSVDGVSGPITVVNVGGDARIENVDGRVSLSGVAGSANVETVSGEIQLRGVKGERVRVSSVSGGIDFTGAISGSGRYEFETHSGQTNLVLASNANGSISVETYTGSISNSYPGAVRKDRSDSDDESQSYEYVVGRGDGHVRVETFSGSVNISQGKP